jgi:hypothetical protein
MGIVTRLNSSAVITEKRGSDVYKRVRLALDDMPADDARLAEMLAYWTDLRNGSLLPSLSDIDPIMLKRMMGWTHIVDTSASNPENYFYRLWGSSVRLDSGKDHTRMMLGSCPWPILRDTAMQDYAHVVSTGEPAYNLITHTVNYVRHSFARLLLPLAKNGRQVDQLLVMINERPLPGMETAGKVVELRPV